MLTMRAHQLISTATHLYPDGLISKEILALADQRAVITPVGKRCGRPRVTQCEINTLIVHAARAGHSVVRLKSGDPLIFGRASEEIEALREASIPLEIVPGITAAFAAAATLQTPLTDRTSASKLILATAHHALNRADPIVASEAIWRGSLPSDATLVLYMPGPDLEALSRDLIAAGIDRFTPVTAISRISAADQRTHHAELGKLRSVDCGPAPILLLIGQSLTATKVSADPV